MTRTSDNSEPEWDVVVIGSGAGGLGAAVALSNVGKRVLVLEQHYLPGGWTHTFALQGHKFSPGVHYIGGLEEGGRRDNCSKGLVSVPILNSANSIPMATTMWCSRTRPSTYRAGGRSSCNA